MHTRTKTSSINMMNLFKTLAITDIHTVWLVIHTLVLPKSI